ncbi:hypothetical protein N7488_004557 [Penicillium malachiteum]|nr:hypothetical protein N7488_004557 [Penicillium malachiteum]
MYEKNGKAFSFWFPIFWKSVETYTNPPSMTALHLASFNGHEREVEFLLSLGKNDINSADSRGTYPIVSASWNGSEKVVQLLLEKGAEVNAQGGDYGNALQAASFGGHE